MFDFNKADSGSLAHDIGGQAAENDLLRKLFGAFQGFDSEDEAWQDMRKSEFGAWLFEELASHDEWEFNGSAKEGDDEE